MTPSTRRSHLARLTLAAAGLAAIATTAVASDQQLPVIMKVPAGNYVAWRAPAEGVVTYICQQSVAIPPQTAWSIQRAQATLSGDSHRGSYSSPPETWRADDGSFLTGMEVVRVNPGEGRMYDQLVMANPAGAAGLLSNVTYIQRLVKSGGGIPDAACDAAAVGRQVEVPFQAQYVFWKPN